MKTEPIDVRLPNGLIISMDPLPAVNAGTTFAPKVISTEESQRHLWQRFVEAMRTTDWQALGKFYESTMPKEPLKLTEGQVTMAVRSSTPVAAKT